MDKLINHFGIKNRIFGFWAKLQLKNLKFFLLFWERNKKLIQISETNSLKTLTSFKDNTKLIWDSISKEKNFTFLTRKMVISNTMIYLLRMNLL